MLKNLSSSLRHHNGALQNAFCDILLLGDGVLAIIGYIIKSFYRHHRKVFSILHGLDVTLPMWLYKLWIRTFFPNLMDILPWVMKRQAGVQGAYDGCLRLSPTGLPAENWP